MQIKKVVHPPPPPPPAPAPEIWITLSISEAKSLYGILTGSSSTNAGTAALTAELDRILYRQT